MTTLFIILSFGIIVVVDIFLLVNKKPTITSKFRLWFGTLPVVPYAIGAVFIGHFGLPINFDFIPFNISLALFIIISALFLIYNIVKKIQADSDDNKVFAFLCKHWYINMAVGAVIGSLWRAQ